MKGYFMWNFVIRLFLEASLELSFCCFINVYFLGNLATASGFFEFADYLVTILIIGVIFFLPFFIIVWYICKHDNFENLKDEEFEEKWGAVYEGLDTT